MDILEAVNQRKSIRAFKPDPVPQGILKEIMELALRAPSWGNTQPWEFSIASGKRLEAIQEGFVEKGEESPKPDIARPYEFPEPYASRRRSPTRENRGSTGEATESRRIRNFKHYGAPAVIYVLVGRNFFFQTEGINVWSLYDCGSVVQNIMLLATNYGLGTIAQAQAVVYPDVIRRVLGIPESKLIALGVAVGYPDWDNLVNQTRAEREPLDKITKWYGFD